MSHEAETETPLGDHTKKLQLRDLESEAGALAIAADYRMTAAELACDDDLDDPIAFIVGRVERQSGQPSPDGNAIIYGASGNSSQELAGTVRTLSRQSQAVAVIVLCHAWSIDPERLRSLPASEVAGQPKRWASCYEDHPRRTELAVVTMEHVAFGGTRAWFARITRANGKISVSEFVDQGVTEGLWPNLLPSVN